MHPFHHARSSVKKFGGVVEDYLPIHNWFDETKKHICDCRHRALRHHAEGIFWCEEKFGTTIKISTGKEIPVRVIAEQHVMEHFVPNRILKWNCIPSNMKKQFLHFTVFYKSKIST